MKHHYKEKKSLHIEAVGQYCFRRLWKIPLKDEVTFIQQSDYCIMVLDFKNNTVILETLHFLIGCHQTF